MAGLICGCDQPHQLAVKADCNAKSNALLSPVDRGKYLRPYFMTGAFTVFERVVSAFRSGIDTVSGAFSKRLPSRSAVLDRVTRSCGVYARRFRLFGSKAVANSLLRTSNSLNSRMILFAMRRFSSSVGTAVVGCVPTLAPAQVAHRQRA
jgi:hypothetical protein